MSDKVFNPEEKAKLTHLINEGCGIMAEIEDLRGGLNDTIKSIAEDMEIKPSILKKAVSVAYKSNFSQTEEEYDLLDTILDIAGRKS